MKVQLARTFAIPSSADTAWTLLRDVERVAGCMPGATITERAGDGHYKGTVAVKFGPASLSFRGEVRVVGIDGDTRTLRLSGQGTDTTGSSAAAMDLTARVEPLDGMSCSLVGSSEVSMSGRAAAFGGRMMGSVADQVLTRFAANFAAEALAQHHRSLLPSAAAVGATPPGGEPASGAAASDAPSAPPKQAAPVDGLALVWRILRDWLRSLFRPRRA